MTLSFPIGEAEISPELAEILAEARKLQVARMQAAFDGGWRLPEGVCQKYHERYLSERRSAEVAAVAYLEMYGDFTAEIESAGGFPTEWSSLDPITLFGEICAGERTESGLVGSLRLTHTLH